MSVESRVTYLTEALDRQISSFNDRREVNKRRAFWLKMLATLFSTAITILLGLQGLEIIQRGPILVKNSALVLSALVTLLNTWDAFFNHRALWVRYTGTASALKAIQAELEYLSSGDKEGLKQEDLDRLFQRYQSVLDDTNIFWQSLRDERSLSKKPN